VRGGEPIRLDADDGTLSRARRLILRAIIRNSAGSLCLPFRNAGSASACSCLPC
jgi:hypothetical protein